MSAADLAAQLRQARADQGLSQRDVSGLIGVTGGTSLSGWECGRTEPILSSLVRWAGALGYDVTLTPRSQT